jgi:hypothetical protein
MDDSAGTDPLLEIIVVKAQSLCCFVNAVLPGKLDRRIPEPAGKSRSRPVGLAPNLKMPLEPFKWTVDDGRQGFFC